MTESFALKALASNDGKSRQKSLAALRIYLSQDKEFTVFEMLKLWKGIFYCFWMTDKIQNQQQLARDIADITLDLNSVNISTFLATFYTTLARQWPTLDNKRMDKFYYIARRFIRVGFMWGAQSEWDTEVVESYCKVLSEVLLSSNVADGIKYHICQVYLEELTKLYKFSDVPLATILEPFKQLREKTHNKVMKEKLDVLLEEGSI